MGTLMISIFVGAVNLTALPHPAVNAAGSESLQQTPDMQILQGPGSEIRASVRDLRPADRRPSPAATGVAIDQVVRGGPADVAGLRRGDVVTEFDSLPVTSLKAFDRLVRDTPAGREVKAVIWRDGVRREVMISPVAATGR